MKLCLKDPDGIYESLASMGLTPEQEQAIKDKYFRHGEYLDLELSYDDYTNDWKLEVIPLKVKI
jgi:hypothetical protein